MADSGIYSCIFPHLQPRQTYNIELVVGASPKPYITTLDQTKDWSLLQCEVRGASPEPKVEWQDSSGNILPAEEPQVSERGGRYYVTLNTTVTKTGRYRCEATQEEISHQTSAEIYVFINENSSTKLVIGLLFGVIFIAALILLVATKCFTVNCNRDFQQRRNRSDESTPIAAEPQRPQVTYSTTTPHDMEQENNRRASVNRADTELTLRRTPDPGD
ncbi:selection and upkeep of intraepithelial T-cells protein 2-like isoform X3 [Sparus aurata]|uniref:selection and upkeep of intraepithelial T-cells protein 2-like isoform X3 n=1 Tax=Sparus aurata TaxID=8175 RepID=UPI0011C157AF|nr:selection and upkeep of intraepithelial T-cells protein 2-like isoform X3 [Sparus aurata]